MYLKTISSRFSHGYFAYNRQYIEPLHLIHLLISLFTSRNFFVILAAIMAYFLAKNKGILEIVLPKPIIGDSNLMENKKLTNHKEKKKF